MKYSHWPSWNPSPSSVPGAGSAHWTGHWPAKYIDNCVVTHIGNSAVTDMGKSLATNIDNSSVTQLNNNDKAHMDNSAESALMSKLWML